LFFSGKPLQAFITSLRKAGHKNENSLIFPQQTSPCCCKWSLDGNTEESGSFIGCDGGLAEHVVTSEKAGWNKWKLSL
jgi:hypothetical protein